MTNKITTLFELDDKGFTRGLKQLRTDVVEADGVLGKMKAGASGLGGLLKENLAAAAVGAGTAIAAFGLQSANAFKDAAIGAGEFSGATGIAVEDASRWISVAGDFELKGDAVQGALLKMNKALADGKPVFEDYGVEIVRTKDGLVDANQTFINALTTIGAIEDPTLRAKAAQEAFGRSYGEVSRLMEMSATDLRDTLMATQEEQVFDEDEVRKAREYQAVMDQLGDVFVDLQMRVGELVVELAPAISDLATMADQVTSLTDKVGGLGNIISWTADQINIFDNAGSAWNRMTGENRSGTERLMGAVEGLTSWVPVLGEGVQSLNERLFDGAEKAEHLGEVLGARLVGDVNATAMSVAEAILGADEYAKSIGYAGDESATAATKVLDLKNAAELLDESWSDLKGEIDDRQAFLSLQDTFVDIKAKADESWEAASSGAEDATLKARQHEQAILDGKARVIEYLSEVLKLPPERSTHIVAAYDQGNIDQVEQMLATLSRNRTMNLSIVAKGGLGNVSISDQAKPRAAGGQVLPGRAYSVGDNPDGSWNATTELFVPSEPGAVLSAADARAALGGGGGGLTVVLHQHVTPGVDRARLGREMIELIQAAQRQDGPVFVTAR